MRCDAAPLFVRKECMDIRAKNYLQEVRELYLAAEQDEEVAQGYLLLAEKCKLKKYMELLEKARDKADQSAAVYNQRKQIVIEQIKELKYSVFVHVLMGIYVDFKMLKEIAYDEHISYQEVRGMHEPALKCFEEFHSDALDEWERGRR